MKLFLYKVKYLFYTIFQITFYTFIISVQLFILYNYIFSTIIYSILLDILYFCIFYYIIQSILLYFLYYKIFYTFMFQYLFYSSTYIFFSNLFCNHPDVPILSILSAHRLLPKADPTSSNKSPLIYILSRHQHPSSSTRRAKIFGCKEARRITSSLFAEAYRLLVKEQAGQLSFGGKALTDRRSALCGPQT